MLSLRETYHSTGRVSWKRLALSLVLSCPFALLAGCALCLAFRGGFYLMFFVPLFAGLLAGATASITVSAGHCRNRFSIRRDCRVGSGVTRNRHRRATLD